MSDVIDLQQFPVGKTFCIPTYQRDYAWTIAQVDDLFGDVQEALDASSTHYLGTIVLAQRGDAGYDIVVGVSARLYPLIIRLHLRRMLLAPVPGANVDLLHCLEACEVRIYKTRGTDPARGIGHVSHRSRTATVQEIGEALKAFITQFMPDGSFQVYLGQNMYDNGALVLLLLSYDEHVAGQPYPLSTLVPLVTDHITREHIIARTPHWSVSSYGFTDDIDHESHLHTLGHLTLLSQAENSRCTNQPPHTKMTAAHLYAQSKFAATRQLAHQYATAGGMYRNADLVNRTQMLTAFVLSNWCLWQTPLVTTK